jgi:hypothetical protein
MFDEQCSLNYDKKAYMYGRVVNKNARWNICFSDFSQEPDYENKKGRIIDFRDVSLMRFLRDKLSQITDSFLIAECNYYYDVKKTGIGFHDDSERKKIIGVKLGEKIPLCSVVL